MTQSVYINSIGTFLPGKPVENSMIESHLGVAGGDKSRNRAFVLRQNKIKTRHYALDAAGAPYTSNAKMAAQSILDAVEKSEISLNNIASLSTSTTIADQLLPGLASHVQAELGIGPIEIASMQSVCASFTMALKNAYLQIKAGEHDCAVATGSEFASRYLKASFYENSDYFKEHGAIPMDADFLRFTLSDGAGAAVLENKKNEHGISLEIKWINVRSYAHQFETCMTGGTTADGKYWGDFASPSEAEQKGALMLVQDFALLKKMMPIWVAHYMDMIDLGKIVIADVDHVCCHYSAHSIKLEAQELIRQAGAMIDEEKWFTNLYSKGNTGSASMLIMLEELMYSGKLKKGETILCHVPESGRCLNSYIMLEVV
jgi:3-oxoacyl-[acyl-carrier-protein] synthase-3